MNGLLWVFCSGYNWVHTQEHWSPASPTAPHVSAKCLLFILIYGLVSRYYLTWTFETVHHNKDTAVSHFLFNSIKFVDVSGQLTCLVSQNVLQKIIVVNQYYTGFAGIGHIYTMTHPWIPFICYLNPTKKLSSDHCNNVRLCESQFVAPASGTWHNRQ